MQETPAAEVELLRSPTCSSDGSNLKARTAKDSSLEVAQLGTRARWTGDVPAGALFCAMRENRYGAEILLAALDNLKTNAAMLDGILLNGGLDTPAATH